MSTEVQRARWSRPLAGIALVAVVGAGLGAYFGIRAVQGAGSASSAGQPPARSGAAMALPKGSAAYTAAEAKAAAEAARK